MLEKPTIIVDPREKNKRIFYWLEKLNVEYVMSSKNLPMGDYKIGDIYIELKSNTNDAINSIKSRRANNQAFDLSSMLKCSYFVFLGNPQIKLQDLTYKLESYIAQLVSLSLRTSSEGAMGHINVITLFSELEFVYWLKHIQKRAMDLNYREPLAEKLVKYSRKEEYAIPFLVQSIPNIGEELAKALLLHFGSILAVFNASEDELKEVPKIGKKKAEFIYNFVRKDFRNLHYTPKQVGVN